jgi:ornithine decarboxylase
LRVNPSADVLDRIAALGANFDLASMGEIDRCRGLRIGADRLSFGNTIKREADIRQAHSIGINMFAFDSLARAAPGSGVFCRM